jgi:hypothetical protein
MAALVLGLDGYATFGQLRQAEAAADIIELQLQGSADALQLGEDVRALEQLTGLAQSRVDRRLGGRSRLGAMARAIAAATPPEVVLEHAALSRSGTESSCSLTGYIGGPPEQAAAALRDYAAALADLPVVSGVQLGPAARSELNGAEVRYFSLHVGLVQLPAWTQEDRR